MAVTITPSAVNTSMADALTHALAQTRIGEQDQPITDVQPKVKVVEPAVAQSRTTFGAASAKEEAAKTEKETPCVPRSFGEIPEFIRNMKVDFGETKKQHVPVPTVSSTRSFSSAIA